jgi:hypothetical protein
MNPSFRTASTPGVSHDFYLATAVTAVTLAEYQKALQEAGEKLLTTRATTARDAGGNVDTKLITVGNAWGTHL